MNNAYLNKPINLRLLMIGDSGVGKTALTIRYVDDTPDTNYPTTIGIDFKIKTIDINGIRYKVQIWDTAGQERFRTITKSYFRGSMGVFVVYDATRRSTFNSVSQWIVDTIQNTDETTHIVLIGNKTDAADHQEVHENEGRALAEKYQIPFFSCSSKRKDIVDLIFNHMVLRICEIHGYLSDTSVPNTSMPDTSSTSTKSRTKKLNTKDETNTKISLTRKESETKRESCC